MFTWYFVDGVLILKFSVSPGLTLIWVAKPWIVSSPSSSTCHSAGGTPSLEFSQTIGLVTGAAQGPVSAAVAGAVPPPIRVKRMNAAQSAATNARATRYAWRCSLEAVITTDNATRPVQTCAAGRRCRMKKGLVRGAAGAAEGPDE